MKQMKIAIDDLQKFVDKLPVSEDSVSCQASSKQRALYILLTQLSWLTLREISKDHAERIRPQLDPKVWESCDVQSIAPLAKQLSVLGPSLPQIWEELYSRLNDPSDTKKLGKYYTPKEIVTYILDGIGYGVEAVQNQAILFDPACGCGAFLREAVHRIIEAAPPQQAWSLMCRTLYGVDIDPIAVQLSKISLALLCALADVPITTEPLRIYCADALSLGTKNAGFLEKPVNDPHIPLADYVVGNPPYGKVPSSDPRVSLFRSTIYGHANIYGMFLQYAVESLRPRGYLGFIVPKSFSSGLYFKKLRAFLNRELEFHELTTFTSRKKIFNNVLQETVILIAQRKPCYTQGMVKLREFRTHKELERRSSAISVPQHKICLGKEYQHIFCITANKAALDILDKVRQRSRPLISHGLQASTGKLVWNRVKPYLRHSEDEKSLPLYWAHNVRPFRFLPDYSYNSRTRFVEFNENTRSFVNTPEELVLVKRVTAKEQPRRLEAAYVPATFRANTLGFFLENHLNYIARKQGTYDMKILCALLNSTLFDFIFRIFSGNTQVSATELNHMPILDEPSEHLRDLSHRILEVPDEKISELKLEIDLTVYRLYGLSQREIGEIQAFYERSFGDSNCA
jgi:adenine-specific DNA-methyltransferase